jgi:hypothetical protein
MIGEDDPDVAAGEGKSRRYQELLGRMSRLIVTETSRDGTVTVTVDNTGVLTDLRLRDDVRERVPAALGEEIVQCLGRAQSALRREVAAIVAGTIGEGDTGTAIIEQYVQRFPDSEPCSEHPGM